MCGVFAADPVMGWRLFLTVLALEREVPKMDVILYIDNLSISTTEEELKNLFLQAGEVTSVKINKDRTSGVSKGYAFLSMSYQSEADKAVSRFNSYSLKGSILKVRLSKPRAIHGGTNRGFGS